VAPRTATRIATRARALRKAKTEPEIMLCSRLKGRGTDRPIFRRQVAFGNFILDFYCPAAKLAVEIDGPTHWDDAAQAKDAARDAWLKAQGVEVLRIGGGEAYRDPTRVADAVILAARARIGG
jgi:very-short-patch-repair endonuclease